MRTKLEIPTISIKEGRAHFKKMEFDLTEEEATIKLEFMYTLTRIIFRQCFDIE